MRLVENSNFNNVSVGLSLSDEHSLNWGILHFQVKPTRTFLLSLRGSVVFSFLPFCVDFLTVAHWAALLIGVKGMLNESGRVPFMWCMAVENSLQIRAIF